jgi:hypothetical protein
MSLPDLESRTDMLFSMTDDLLGDTITVVPPSSAPTPITLKANVTHRDRRADFGVSAATVQDAMIDLDMSLVPGKPGIGWRVALPRIPGVLFEPRDTQRDDSGKRWEFGLKKVPNA